MHITKAIILLSLSLIGLNLNAQRADYHGEKLLLDENWLFKLGDASSGENEMHYYGKNFNPFSKSGRTVGVNSLNYPAQEWRQVDLPHDWAVELPFVKDASINSHGFKPVGWKFPETSVGWYRKKVFIPNDDKGKNISIKFDGVYRDCDVWFNGFYQGNNKSGYMEFLYDVTDMVQYGDTNLIVVRVDASQDEGWWYEGAGIYRHTWLIKKSPVHIPEYGTYVSTSLKSKSTFVNIQTEVLNALSDRSKIELSVQVIDREGNVSGSAESELVLNPNQKSAIKTEILLQNPHLWSLNNPYLYRLVSTLKVNGVICDKSITKFGVRSINFDPDKGLFVNGQPVKIKGACVHQDHAGVGVALPDRLQYYRIELLKKMGCNGYRSAHHPPTSELLDACDSLGMLVMAENRLLTSSSEQLSQFERLIKRDRNHPSVIIWSLGNEEHDIQNSDMGARVAQRLKRVQQELDPSRLCTYGGNNGPQFEGPNQVVDVRGYNYIWVSDTNGERKDKVFDIDKYHEAHPHQPILGSEEASTLCTRGQYSVDLLQGYLPDYDKKVNVPYWWCSNAEEWWKFYDSRQWLAGGFLWTGFDYRGEPSPYREISVNSHFGVMDVCGFPKNNYYYYKAWWTSEDVLHVFPHWNWPGKAGETINVWCHTNCGEVELFLNGKSLGRKKVEKNSHVEWEVKYQPGLLEARGIKNGKEIVKKVETTGMAAKIILTPDRKAIAADGRDVSVINVTVQDDKGREVPDAMDFIEFDITGEGKIIGVGNGNPASTEPDKILNGKYHRNLFNGKCQVIIQSSKKQGNIVLKARSEKLTTAVTEILTLL